MKRRGLLFAAAAAAALMLQLGTALGTTRDSAAVRTVQIYVHARYVLARELVGGLGRSEAAVKAYVQNVAAECPDVLSGAPHGEGLFEFFAEEVNAFDAVVAQSFEADVASYANALRRLRWPTPRLRRILPVEVGADVKEAHQVPPALCSEFKAWAASGYKTLPPTTSRLARADIRTSGSGEANENITHPHERLWRILKPFESLAVQKLARRTQHLEGQYAIRTAGMLLSVSDELDKLLGLNAEQPAPVSADAPLYAG
jgi:hypothetical protein